MTNKTQVTETSKFGKVRRAVTSSKGGTGITLTQKVSLAVDLDKHDTSVLPRQCQLLLNLLEVANGTVTMGDIVKYFETATDEMFWGKGGKQYEQDCAKTTSHYSAKLLGNDNWEGTTKAHLNGVALFKLS